MPHNHHIQEHVPIRIPAHPPAVLMKQHQLSPHHLPCHRNPQAWPPIEGEGLKVEAVHAVVEAPASVGTDEDVGGEDGAACGLALGPGLSSGEAAQDAVAGEVF